LAFNRSDIVTFPGVISGTGSVVQIGPGTTILTNVSPYTGGTAVDAGTLAVGDPAHPGAALSGGGSITIAPGATLGGYGSVTGPVTNDGTIAAASALGAFAGGPIGNFTVNGNLLNNGVINLAGSAVGNTLTVVGNYAGGDPFLLVNTFLGGDSSPSDKLVISGGAATGNTSLHVTNAGGPGAETVANGILVVQAINGATTAPGAFTLLGEARAGDITYDLFRGGQNGSEPSDWFLRSSFIVPGPTEPEEPIGPSPPPEPLPPGIWPIIGPELATYGVVQPIARQLGLDTLGTLHERIGDTLTLENASTDSTGWTRSEWGRFFGQQINNQYQAFADPRASGWMGGFQGGIDLWRGASSPAIAMPLASTSPTATATSAWTVWSATPRRRPMC
jgi:autotransporter-associated beta strand protein